MKASEWHALESRFNWDMYKDTSPEDGDDWILDFDAPKNLPDGKYNLLYGDERGMMFLEKCIKVKSGKIVPSKNTREAIYITALCGDFRLVNKLSKDERDKIKDVFSGGLLRPYLMGLSWFKSERYFKAYFNFSPFKP